MAKIRIYLSQILRALNENLRESIEGVAVRGTGQENSR